HAAAHAIMTTDTRPKEIAVRARLGGHEFVVAGMVKGAGMISPNMATLLCVLTTDAALAPVPAAQALREAVEAGFNLITVDGDTSTNDTALLLASGESGAARITSVDSAGYALFREALTHVVVALAKEIVRDGEGASHFVAIRVSGARSRTEAKQVAMSVAKSPLVKTAVYGRDANWGRVACAAGYSGVAIDPQKVTLWLGDMEVFRHGEPLPLDEGRAAALLAEADVAIRIDLGQGAEEITAWTCDLTHAYVDVNAHYRS
ncbi:MAG: bifunctional ornithine acetyltransferase/N-acetylglutamate synthase, partial [Chloroflexi bacterium]|nr:bifunctional ornithine acetyltransferase/N-acetylglutamate synthase [Chloroflexota bacterium]